MDEDLHRQALEDWDKAFYAAYPNEHPFKKLRNALCTKNVADARLWADARSLAKTKQEKKELEDLERLEAVLMWHERECRMEMPFLVSQVAIAFGVSHVTAEEMLRRSSLRGISVNWLKKGEHKLVVTEDGGVKSVWVD